MKRSILWWLLGARSPAFGPDFFCNDQCWRRRNSGYLTVEFNNGICIAVVLCRSFTADEDKGRSAFERLRSVTASGFGTCCRNLVFFWLSCPWTRQLYRTDGLQLSECHVTVVCISAPYIRSLLAAETFREFASLQPSATVRLGPSFFSGVARIVWYLVTDLSVQYIRPNYEDQA